MKNKDSMLFSTLENLATHQRILLTGAPLPVSFYEACTQLSTVFKSGNGRQSN